MTAARARLLGLGSALPAYGASQEHAAGFLARVLEASLPARRSARAVDLVLRLAQGTGIERRHSVLSDYGEEEPSRFTFFPPDWSLEPFPGTARRMELYERESVALAEEAARRALEQADVPPAAVTHLVVATCTGFFAPGPDVLLAGRLGLRSDVGRCVVGFMGCQAAFPALRVARGTIAADPDAVVLQVNVELCSLHYQKRPEPDLLVASSLFADGAAAAVWGASGRGPRGLADLVATRSEVEAGTLDRMSWRIGDHGFEMRLATTVPDTLAARAPGLTDALLDAAGYGRGPDLGWAVHPGGPRILECIAGSLGLDATELAASSEVLRRAGNMSSGTVLFVLEELLRGGPVERPVVALAFGPGLSFEGAVLAPP